MTLHRGNPGARGLAARRWLALFALLALCALLATAAWVAWLFVFPDSPGRAGLPVPLSKPPGVSVPPVDFGPVPSGYRALILPAPPTHVMDGDTFEADLNGDGELSLPGERVRLLFVDTPELEKSWKGKDSAHGLPAKEYLKAALDQGPLRLLIPIDRPTGKYGRTLAVIQPVIRTGNGNSGKRAHSVNLSLIRAGHGYFDTRFGFPPGYDDYRLAEGEAFDSRAGIWNDETSRAKYLKRSRREGRTPAARSNPDYVDEIMVAVSFRPESLMGKYIRLRGTLVRLKKLRRGVRLLHLERGRGRKPFPAVAFRNAAKNLGLEKWSRKSRIYLEGFIQAYKGKPQLVVHFGRVLM